MGLVPKIRNNQTGSTKTLLFAVGFFFFSTLFVGAAPLLTRYVDRLADRMAEKKLAQLKIEDRNKFQEDEINKQVLGVKASAVINRIAASLTGDLLSLQASSKFSVAVSPAATKNAVLADPAPADSPVETPKIILTSSSDQPAFSQTATSSTSLEIQPVVPFNSTPATSPTPVNANTCSVPAGSFDASGNLTASRGMLDFVNVSSFFAANSISAGEGGLSSSGPVSFTSTNDFLKISSQTDLNNTLDLDINSASALTVGDGTADTFSVDTLLDIITLTGRLSLTGDQAFYGTTAITAASTTAALTITQNGTGNILNLFDGADNILTVLDGGQVGIGTSSPYEKLSVAGNVTADGTITASSIIATSSISSPYYIATAANATSTFAGGFTAGNNNGFAVNQAAPANSLYITDSGNVGIGTTSPAGKFQAVYTNGGMLLKDGAYAPSILFGHSENTINDGASSAVIAGGGYTSFPNIISGADSRYTVIAGGYDNQLNGIANTISGGAHHRITLATHGIIAGGSYNTLEKNSINSDYNAILGGTYNSITDAGNSVIVGGEYGAITADYGVILGGSYNSVSGQFGVAMGHRAKATATGAVMFADSQNIDTTNSVVDSFAARYQGGYYLNSIGALNLTGANTKQIALVPTSDATATLDFDMLAPLSPTSGSSAVVRMFRNTNVSGNPQLQIHRGINAASVNILLSGNGNSYFNALTGNVGIGTTSPTQKLDVAGFINTDQYSGYKQAGNTILYASSTNFSILVGKGAGSALNSNGLYNTVLGYEALKNATSTPETTAIGYKALYSNISGGVDEGRYNTAIGYLSMFANTTGHHNTATGWKSLNANTTGIGNSAFGEDSLMSNSTGSDNTSFGTHNLYLNTTGYSNTAVGSSALSNNTTGYWNTAIGASAGISNFGSIGTVETDDKMIFIGALAGVDKSVNPGPFTNSTAIGFSTRVTSSNQIVLGNPSVTQTLLRGNIGIGTTSPQAQLNIFNSSGTATFRLDNGVNTLGEGRSQLQFFANASQASANKKNFAINNLNASAIGGENILSIQSRNDDGSAGMGLLNITASGNVGAGEASPTARLVIKGGGNTSATTAFQINNSDNTGLVTALNNGNVGIGTTSPGAKLSINANSAAFTPISIGTGGTSVVNISDNVDAVSGMQMGNINAGTGADFRFLIKDTTGHYFAFSQPGTGNSTAALFGLSRNTTDFIFNTAGTARDMAIGTADDTALVFGQNNAEVMRIANNGDVGIGSTSPWAKLSVTNSGAGPSFIVEDAASPDATPFIIDTDGKVGINTKETIQELTVKGDLSIYTDINGLAMIAFSRETTGAPSYVGQVWYNHASNNMGFNVNGDTRIQINNIGNVGIGTTSPIAKLAVSGGDIMVVGGSFIDDGTTLPVADYVFNDDYHLMALNNLKDYITANNHLPGLPDMANKAGWAALSLQDRDMKLLEKIEENTLYIIDHEERIKREEQARLTAQSDSSGSISVNPAERLRPEDIFALDEKGYVTFKKIDAEEVKTAKFSVKDTEQPDESIVGAGLVAAGENKAIIASKEVKETSKIFLSWKDWLSGAEWKICEIKEGESFTVCLDKTVASEIKFDYWILAVEPFTNSGQEAVGQASENPAGAVLGASESAENSDVITEITEPEVNPVPEEVSEAPIPEEIQGSETPNETPVEIEDAL